MILTDKIKGTGRQTSRRSREKTMGYRLTKDFILFSILIMALLWILQILFLQLFYQEIKSRELVRIAETIEEDFGSEGVYDTISSLTRHSDIYVQIEQGNQLIFRSMAENPMDQMNLFAYAYDKDMLKQNLVASGDHAIQIRQAMGSSDSEALIYGSILSSDKDNSDNNIYLFLYSPLTAVGSTINILAKMLVAVTVISIFIGIIMSVVISRRIARPILRITESAEQLSKGDYSTHFDGRGCQETEILAETLNYTTEELQKTDRLQKDLIANVSHDLKTPLTMVKSYAEMIRDLSGDNPEKRNKHLQVIISEADRLNELVNDLTVLSKMQANTESMEITDINLEDLARQSVDSFQLHAEQEGFSFDIEVSGDVRVKADEKKIRQVFANLIGNAVRYSGETVEDKAVTIKLTEMGDRVLCEVSDHGQGIAEEDLESIWDRYYQSSKNLARTSKGTGLGLSIVKQIFILHGAEYGVDSTLGEGSRFWFKLKKDPDLTSK